MRRPISSCIAASAVALRSPIAADGAGPQSRSARSRRGAAPACRTWSQEYGGAETGARAAYVEGVGRRVAAYSGVANPGQTYRFTTLNSAVENAFAVPGGYIYITRQLMGLMDDEAELAFVLGHETGHIAANHAQARRVGAAAQFASLACSARSSAGGRSAMRSAICSRRARNCGRLSFSRDQEYQADTLGMRYLIARPATIRWARPICWPRLAAPTR